jgi:hypothetical protein
MRKRSRRMREEAKEKKQEKKRKEAEEAGDGRKISRKKMTNHSIKILFFKR